VEIIGGAREVGSEDQRPRSKIAAIVAFSLLCNLFEFNSYIHSIHSDHAILFVPHLPFHLIASVQIACVTFGRKLKSPLRRKKSIIRN